MSVAAARGFSASTLLRLGRTSNLPTVWTNVIAGTVIAGGVRRPSEIALIALAMSAFYVGGMYLNDFFDRSIDARERPTRPIAAGEISAGTVSGLGFGLLVIGIALMVPFGLAAIVRGIALAGVIVVYDIWHKGNALGPTIMGLCRALVYLGAGAAVIDHVSLALAIGAFVLAAHTAGISYAAKQESLDTIGNLWPMLLLAAPLIAALPSIAGGRIVLLAFALLLVADAAAVWLLAKRPVPHSVPRAVSGLIAAISLVDALAVAWAAGDLLLVLSCAAGYPLTRLFQASIPGT
ncbi:MAG TPA: UbiA family prenyltransferase [Xanthobacteraceae bacterium]|nr:UbiA family prenyltransferase [Xanthobacteraceae bacterium]